MQANTKISRILVVDDMKVNFLAITKVLAPHPYECTFEKTPELVLELAQSTLPDAILLDFEMPGMSGPEVCTQLKNNYLTAHIPVIFVTSQNGDQELARAFEAGADDYVLKPVREKELLARLTKSLQNRELQKELHERVEDQVMITRILSHDINNLLTLSLNGATGLHRILTEVCPAERLPDVTKYHGRLHDSLKRLAALVDHVKKLQSLEDRKLDIVLSSVSLMQVLNEAKNLFVERLNQKSQSFEIVCDGDPHISAERAGLLNSVISNLLSNSIKFSESGKKINARVKAEDKLVTLEFSDQGIGMDTDMMAKIFSKSEKTSRPGTQNEKGTGFGMPIVKRYMDLFAGSIQVTSKSRDEYPEESGTTFLLHFKKVV